MRLREFFQPHFLCLNPCKKNAKWQCVSNAVSPCPTGTLPRSPQLRFARLAHKKMRSAAVRLCFAVPNGHTPLFSSTSLCSFGSQKKCEVQPQGCASPCPAGTLPSSPQLHFARLAHKKCEMAVRQRCRFAIKVFEGVQGEAFFRKFPLLFPA